jgi:hypothetical protein
VRNILRKLPQVHRHHAAVFFDGAHDQVEFNVESGRLGGDIELGAVGENEEAVDQGLFFAVVDVALALADEDVQLHGLLYPQAHSVNLQQYSQHI